ncbi:hypothetical protein V8E36_001038 [Tilletia maclaganii]
MAATTATATATATANERQKATEKKKKQQRVSSKASSSTASSNRKRRRDEPSSGEEDEDEDEDEENDAATRAYGLGVLQQFGFDAPSFSSARSTQATSSKAKLTASDKPQKQVIEAEPRKALPTRRVPETVVFDGAGTSASSSLVVPKQSDNTFVDSKAARKAFMSSRIERIGSESGVGKGKGRASTTDADDEENAQEKEHRANDRLLSHLLSTTLFATGADASSSPATKRNGKPSLDPSKGTLASILELSSTHEQRKGASVGRGWGDAQARVKELGKMPDRLRTGLKRAAKERVEKEQDRARELGLVHRSLSSGKRKNMGGTGAVSAVDMALSGVGASKQPKDRVRGLGMGVGKFGGGKLTISARDVEKINGPAPSRRAPGGGGKRGSGGGPANKKQRR